MIGRGRRGREARPGNQRHSGAAQSHQVVPSARPVVIKMTPGARPTPGAYNAMRFEELRAPVIGGQRPGHPPVLANAVPDRHPFTSLAASHRNPATPLVDLPLCEELDRVVLSRVASAAAAGFETFRRCC